MPSPWGSGYSPGVTTGRTYSCKEGNAPLQGRALQTAHLHGGFTTHRATVRPERPGGGVLAVEKGEEAKSSSRPNSGPHGTAGPPREETPTRLQNTGHCAGQLARAFQKRQRHLKKGRKKERGWGECVCV